VGDPATGHVYALGVQGTFICINGETGETIWSRSLGEEFGMVNVYGGRTNVPVVFDDLAIISAVTTGWGDQARPTHRFMAFDKATGECRWVNGTRPQPEDTTYSVPQLAVIQGQAQMIFGSSDGDVWSFQPRTGKPLWNYTLSPRGLNCSPMVMNGVVYAGSSEENRDDNTMGAIAAINPTLTGNITKTGELWRTKELAVGRSSPILLGNRLIIAEDTGTMHVVNAETGESLSKTRLIGTMMRASLLYADGRIYAGTTTGWHVLEPNGDKLKVIQRMRLPQGEEIHGSPSVSHGRIYIPMTTRVVCLANKDAGAPQATPIPAAEAEADVKLDTKPAQIQIVPADAIVKPGETVQFKTRTFNAKGQLLDEQKATFAVDAAGKVDAAGLYTADALPAHRASLVTAKLGELTSVGRVRVVPDLSWKFDFSDGVVPVTWIGLRHRHIGIDVDLYDKLKAADPQAAKLYVYLLGEFAAAQQPVAKVDDSTPQKKWSTLLRKLELIDKITQPEEFKTAMDPSLKLLVDEKVLAKWTWGLTSLGGPQLEVQRGPRKVDGNGAMVKITTIPKGTRSQGWFGSPAMKDYTIQADLRGAVVNGKVPDMGVIGQRYKLFMMGASQQVMLNTWNPQPRQQTWTAPFAWQPDVWYTVKFQTTDAGDKAILRGKVWPRDQKEPEAWTIEAEDDLPNLNGSPGLYGDATNAEVFVDNVKVDAVTK
jgi:outer membrane protein assembly factor BamB